MKTMIETIGEILEQGQAVVSATILSKKGSAPRGIGTKMLIKEIDLQNYLFKTDVYELPPKARLEITKNLRQEMIEIFSGSNIF